VKGVVGIPITRAHHVAGGPLSTLRHAACAATRLWRLRQVCYTGGERSCIMDGRWGKAICAMPEKALL